MKKNFFNIKNLIFMLCCIIFVVSFAIFSDAFLDKTDPVKVTDFYFNKLTAYEYQELHRITVPPRGEDHLKYYYDQKMFLVVSVTSTLLSLSDDTAQVKSELRYKDGTSGLCVTTLKKIKDKWFVGSLRFNEQEKK
ncbi:MAG: hypothetical protein WCQ53_03320 [bacterium]